MQLALCVLFLPNGYALTKTEPAKVAIYYVRDSTSFDFKGGAAGMEGSSS